MVQENRNPWILKEEWLDHYVYIDIHEIFFATFLIEFYECIMWLADNEGRCRLDQHIVWTLELVRRLEATEDQIACVVDHWLDWVIGVFITEFVIDKTMSYSEAER